MNFKGNFFVLAFLIISNSFTVVYSIESASVLRYYKKNNNQEQNTVQKKNELVVMIEQQIQALELLVKENLELAQKNLKQALNRLANNVHCNNAMQNYDNHFRNGSFWFEMNQKILMFSHNLQYISLRTEEQLRYTLDGLELLRQSIEFNMKKN